MRATLRRGIGLPMAVLALGLYGAGVSPPALAQQAPDPPTAAVGSQSDAVPGTADSNATSAQAPAAGSTPPSSTEGDNGPTMNRSDSAPAAVGLEELDDILTEEPADPATASAAQGEGAPAKTDSATPPSSAEGATAPTTSSTKRAPVTVGLEEIVVTATKREQSSREIPATVNVLSGEELEAIGARELEDYLKLVPGIVMQEGDTNNNRAIAIRGISPQPNAGTTTVGMLINDVSMSDPVSSFLVPDLDPFDLYTVEVLKGPQGTLFGASALNGAVRYVLNKPVLGVTEGKGFANGLTISEGGAGLTWGAALNVPVTDTVALRAAGVWQQRPGLYDDVNANGKNEKDADKGDVKTGRLLGLWQPTDALSINAFYLKQHNFRNNASFANNFDGELVRTDTPGPSTATQEFEVANLDLRYDFDWFTLVSETSRAKKLSDANFDGSFVAEAAATRGVYSLR
ncbi:MAG: TonB-dependent receptor plug domain-containing protein, partial [Nevskiales bacterium]